MARPGGLNGGFQLQNRKGAGRTLCSRVVCANRDSVVLCSLVMLYHKLEERWPIRNSVPAHSDDFQPFFLTSLSVLLSCIQMSSLMLSPLQSEIHAVYRVKSTLHQGLRKMVMCQKWSQTKSLTRRDLSVTRTSIYYCIVAALGRLLDTPLQRFYRF